MGLAANGVAAQSSIPTLKVGSGGESVTIDGRLDESAWQTVDSIPNLTEVEPEQGRSARGRTVVRVLATPKHLIIGVVCAVGEGSRIVSTAKARDVELRDQDHLKLVFDTFRDGRSGYLFAVNPTGSRYDALVSNQGEGENSNWDAIWEAATSVSDSSWSVEIKIPVSSLSFEPASDAWSFNIQRRVQSVLETDRWATPTQDAKFGRTTAAGMLIGLPRFDLGSGLTFRPAITAGAGHPAPNTKLDATGDLSLDIQKKITANLDGTLTFNTDFAETEVDNRRTNLTRFPLFFPEKRAFFLEGADVYEFGSGLRTDLVPFFSRRIGLVDGREVPLRAGAKLTGQIGGTRVGAVISRIGAVDSVAPGTTLGVVRMRRNVGRESAIGAIATFGNPRGGSGLMAGVDGVYRTSRFLGDKNFLAGIWALGADQIGASGDRWAFGGQLDFPNDLVDAAITWKRIGDGFDPALGFVPRRGVHLLNISVNVQPRPKILSIRQAFFENALSLATDLQGRWESYRLFFAPINFRFENGDRFEANVVPQGEQLREPFEVADGVFIGAGTYRFTRYRLEVETAARRAISGQLTWWFGGFYGGTLHQFQVEGGWRPSSTVGFELEAEHNIGRLPEGNFNTTLLEGRVRLNVSPDLQINSLIQYDDESQALGSNTRLRWTITPAAELFLIYNHNLTDRFDRFAFESNQVSAKLAYAWRR